MVAARETALESLVAADASGPDRCWGFSAGGERKLPLCDARGRYNRSLIAAAKAALGPGFRGQQVQLPAGARGPALVRVNAAAAAVGLNPFDGSEPEALIVEAEAEAEAERFAQPDAGAGHVDAPLGSAPAGDGASGSSALLYLRRVRDRLKQRLATQRYLTLDDYDAAVRHARGYAGGIMAGRRAAGEPDDPPDDDPDAAADAAAAARRAAAAPLALSGGERAILFLPLPHAAAEVPARIPYLPRPGTYRHPTYGEVRITPERNARFVANFHARVYGQDLPIDAEHQTKLSGALGYVRDLVANADGSVDAVPEWTDRGRTLLAADRYRYFSPEWFDAWTDPATGQTHPDVAIGGALTTRPFFKEGALRPLTAGEDGQLALGEPDATGWTWVALEPETGERAPAPSRPQGDPMSEQSAPAPAGMTEEQARAFAEAQTEIAALRQANETAQTRLTASEAAATAAAERVAALERERRHERFAAEVRGNGSNPRWFGDPERHVTFLETLADQFGADGAPVQQYREQQQAIAAQLRDSALFATYGSDAPGGGETPLDRLNARARQYAETNKTTFEQGFAAVFTDAENADLVRAYQTGT